MEKDDKKKVNLEKRRVYAKTVHRVKRGYEQSMRTKLKEKAAWFW